jgi:hypothetical protein
MENADKVVNGVTYFTEAVENKGGYNCHLCAGHLDGNICDVAV